MTFGRCLEFLEHLINVNSGKESRSTFRVMPTPFWLVSPCIPKGLRCAIYAMNSGSPTRVLGACVAHWRAWASSVSAQIPLTADAHSSS